MAKSKKKIVRNFSVNALFAGAVLFAPVMVTDLNAAPTQTNQVTWTNIERKTDTTGTAFGGQVVKDSYILQKSNTGQTRKIRTGYELSKYDFDQRVTYTESWKYDEYGNAKEKNITQYVKGTTRYDYQKTYKWVKPGQGSSYLSKESYYNRPTYDVTRKEYNASKYLTRLTVTGKNNATNTITTYTRNSKNAVTKKQVDKYKLYSRDDLRLESRDIKNYYPSGKVKDTTYNTYHLENDVIRKSVFNSYYENGKKKLAKDTYYEKSRSTPEILETRENHYNTKGIKTKNVVKKYKYFVGNGYKPASEFTTTFSPNGKLKKQVIGKEYDYTNEERRYVTKDVLNTFHSNGKLKLARDTMFENRGSWREELKENQYNAKGQRTKSIHNEFYKNKRYHNSDTYYYTNGKKKEVRTNSYHSHDQSLAWKETKLYYTNGKPKSFKTTYYRSSDQTIRRIETTNYTTKGKKTSSTKYY